MTLPPLPWPEIIAALLAGLLLGVLIGAVLVRRARRAAFEDGLAR